MSYDDFIEILTKNKEGSRESHQYEQYIQDEDDFNTVMTFLSLSIQFEKLQMEPEIEENDTKSKLNFIGKKEGEKDRILEKAEVDELLSKLNRRLSTEMEVTFSIPVLSALVDKLDKEIFEMYKLYTLIHEINRAYEQRKQEINDEFERRRQYRMLENARTVRG